MESEYPEAVPRAAFTTFGSSDYEHYEQPHGPENTAPAHSAAQSPDQSADLGYYARSESTALGSQHAPSSPPMTSASLMPDRTTSPSSIDRQTSPPLPPPFGSRYSEVVSPDPQRAYTPPGEKESVVGVHVASAPAYTSGYAKGWPTHPSQPPSENPPRKRPFYKRWTFILALLFLVAVIAVAVACGVIFGTRNHSSGAKPTATPVATAAPTTTPTSTATTSSTPTPTGDPNYAIGGAVSQSYFSTAGVFNGSGIAIAAANPGASDPKEAAVLFAFYQDFQGHIWYSQNDVDTGAWSQIGRVSEDGYPALNGTPLSTVAYLNGTVKTWHLFYLDESYIVRQRSFTQDTNSSETSLTWQTGPLDELEVQAFKNDTIGMQACYWGDYYGLNAPESGTKVVTGMHLYVS